MRSVGICRWNVSGGNGERYGCLLYTSDFLTDPIETEIDGEWLKAKGTTLGADNGIGVATELAILADDSIAHGPLECLFTVDEETGLTGAFALRCV